MGSSSPLRLFRGEDHLISLHLGYPSSSVVCSFPPRTICLLFASLHGFSTGPEGYRQTLAALVVDEDVHPLEAAQLFGQRNELLSGYAYLFVYVVGDSF